MKQYSLSQLVYNNFPTTRSIPFCYVTALIVRRAHLRVMHDGVKETLTELRARYWIIKGQSFVRKIIHQCTTCRRYEGKPYTGPPPPPLPPFWVKEAPPFPHTGVDSAGPIFVKDMVSEENMVWLFVHLLCCTCSALGCCTRFDGGGVPKKL